MPITITVSELTGLNAKVQLNQDVINGALARATRIAPCLAADDLDNTVAAAAKSVLVDALLRTYTPGEVVTETGGVYSVTRRDSSRARPDVLLLPAEIAELQQLCRNGATVPLPQGTFPPPPKEQRW